MAIRRGFLIMCLLTIWVALPTQEYAYANTQENIVYYCTGPRSKKFHKTNKCKGLKHCSGELRKCSKEEAYKKGFTPCRYCYKK